MEKAKRARTAETPKQPSLRLRLCAPYLYPDPWERSSQPSQPRVMRDTEEATEQRKATSGGGRRGKDLTRGNSRQAAVVRTLSRDATSIPIGGCAPEARGFTACRLTFDLREGARCVSSARRDLCGGGEQSSSLPRPSRERSSPHRAEGSRLDGGLGRVERTDGDVISVRISE
jgi:hypothetical protein